MSKYEDDCVKLLNVGDTIYRIGKYGIEEVMIEKIYSYPHYVYKDNKGHSYFNHTLKKSCRRTLEEANAEVEKRRKIKSKKQMLKEYEEKLNKNLGIENHYIIK